MSKKPNSSQSPRSRRPRRVYPEELKREAAQMVLDGHSAASVAERLGLSSTNLLYRWKHQQLADSGPVASSLESRARQQAVLVRSLTVAAPFSEGGPSGPASQRSAL